MICAEKESTVTRMFVAYGVQPFTRSILARFRPVREPFTVPRFSGTINPGLPEQWECQITHPFPVATKNHSQLIYRWNSIPPKEVIIRFTSLVESSTISYLHKKESGTNKSQILNHPSWSRIRPQPFVANVIL